MAQKENSEQSTSYNWVNVKEACQILGISRHTLHRLVQQEILPAWRIEGVRSFQFKREDVENLIKRVKPEDFHVEEDNE